MLDHHPRAQLCFVIQQYGQVIITEPKRCKGMLSDLAPHHRLEINLLIAALEQKVAQELLKPTALIPVAMQLNRLAQCLHDNVGIKEDFAYWAVESWALALGVIQLHECQSAKGQAVVTQTVQSIPTTSIKSNPSLSPPQRINRFIVQDGIATDTKTGLTWLRFSYGETWKYERVVGQYKAFDWEAALQVPEVFNEDGGYAGYSDWRLPTTDELKTLIDKVRGLYSNSIDKAVFPVNDILYWSSSNLVSFSKDIVLKNHGYEKCNGAVRLVRN